MKGLPRWGAIQTNVQIFLWRHGWALPVSALMAIAAVGTHFLVIQPSRAAIAATRAELTAAAAAAGRTAPASGSPTEEQKINALRDILARSPSIDAVVQQMAALAQAEKINVPQSEYVQQVIPGTRAVQVQISQPVRANYPQLRQYVEAVLLAIPNASLDHISARRESIAQSQLEVRLRWSIWLPAQDRGEPPHSTTRAAP